MNVFRPVGSWKPIHDIFSTKGRREHINGFLVVCSPLIFNAQNLLFSILSGEIRKPCDNPNIALRC